jgi:hypothetical protein
MVHPDAFNVPHMGGKSSEKARKTAEKPWNLAKVSEHLSGSLWYNVGSRKRGAHGPGQKLKMNSQGGITWVS